MSMAARKYMADYAGQKRPDVFRAIIRVGLAVQVIISLLLVAFGLLWVFSVLPRDERGFATLAMVSILPAVLMSMATAVNNAVEELRPNVIASVARGADVRGRGVCDADHGLEPGRTRRCPTGQQDLRLHRALGANEAASSLLSAGHGAPGPSVA